MLVLKSIGPVLVGVALIVVSAQWRPDSVSARAQLWQSSANAIAHSPVLHDGFGHPDPNANLRLWLGFGPDLQAAVLDRVHRPRAGITQDRAHQFGLDLLLQFGLCGAVFLVITLTRQLFLQRAQSRRLIAALTGLVIVQVSFFTTATWLLMILALFAETPESDQTVPTKNFRMHRLPTWCISMMCAAASILLFAPFSAHQLPVWRHPEQGVLAFERSASAMQAQPRSCQLRGFRSALQHDRWRVDFADAVETVRNDRTCQAIID